MSFKVDVPFASLKPLFRYFNEAMSLKCFPDLLERELYPNAKELTESFAAFRAVRYGPLRKYYDLQDPSVIAYVIGDGCTPRTGAVFAFRTAWRVVSIDPNMKDHDWKIRRLFPMRGRIEDLPNIIYDNSRVLIIAVHSHATLDVALDRIGAVRLRSVIAIPCCVRQYITDSIGGEVEPYCEYTDRGIWSPENKVKIWINV